MAYTYIVHGDNSKNINEEIMMDNLGLSANVNVNHPSSACHYNYPPTANISNAGIIPAYPTEARPHRSRKPRRRRRKHRQPTSSCSSDNNNNATEPLRSSKRRHKKKTTSKKMMSTGSSTNASAVNDTANPPPVDYDFEQESFDRMMMDGAPQVLLWQSSNARRSSSSSTSESSHNSSDNLKEDRAAAGDIFRQPSYDRQAAPSSTTSSSEAPMDLLAPSGPQWFTLDYWRQLLNGNGDGSNCCLPKRQRDNMDYQPTFGGYPSDQNPWLHQQQQQHHYQQQHQQYYVMPWPQEQLTERQYHEYHQSQLAAWQQQQRLFLPQDPAYQHHNQHEITEEQTDDLLSPVAISPVPVSTTSQEGHSYPTANQGGRKRHARTASSLPTEVSQAYDSFEEDDLGFGGDVGDQSVSSLESLLSGWKTPLQEHSKVLIPPDTHTTEGTQQTMLSSSLFSNRASKLRGSASPRPTVNSKPPVPPLPPTGGSRGMKQHRNQPTNSTMASTALPPLPSPVFTAGYTMTTPVASLPSPRDRSFSEASANTSGSRHRRGGTVCEFSFESLSMNDHSSSNVNAGPARPQLVKTRSSSLPSEVQIQIRYPTAPDPKIRNCRYRLDSSGDDSLVFLDKQQPSRAPPAPQLEEEESGYISPLEEEQYMRNRSTATPGSEAYAGDIDDSPQTQTTATSNSSRNPQDSLCGDDEDDEEENESAGTPTEQKILQGSEGQTSPFAKLKEGQSTIPAGESWMLSWVNQDNNKSSPTQSPSNSSANSSDGSVVVRRRSSKLPRVVEDKVKQEYLPKNLAMEEKWRSNHATSATEGIALSGWVAFGLGESLVEKLANTFDGSKTLLDRSDVAYIIAPSASEKLWVSKPDGSFEPLVEFRDCRAEVQEISRTYGRAVFIKQNDKTLCTLLPVCLPEHYNGCRQLFDPRQCFPQGAYLPDEQQYTTMHVMFALDALLKANQSWAY